MEILSLCIIIIIAIVSVTLHELAHGLVAYFLGDRTAKDAGRLTLNPIKHIDPIMSILVPVLLYLAEAPMVLGSAKPVPINRHNLKGKEWGMALVAIAGPLTNFVIALAAFLIGHALGLIFVGRDGFYIYEPYPSLSFVLGKTMITNLSFMIFNLIPIPPLDGSRILYAISPDFIRNFLEAVERYGLAVAYALIIVVGALFPSWISDGIKAALSLFYLFIS